MALNGVNGQNNYDIWRLWQQKNPEVPPVQPHGEEKPPVDNGYQATLPFGWNVQGTPGIQGTPGVYGTGRTTPEEFYVTGLNGEQISYANSKGEVGLAETAVSPFVGGNAGYHEKIGFKPSLILSA